MATHPDNLEISYSFGVQSRFLPPPQDFILGFVLPSLPPVSPGLPKNRRSLKLHRLSELAHFDVTVVNFPQGIAKRVRARLLAVDEPDLFLRTCRRLKVV